MPDESLDNASHAEFLCRDDHAYTPHSFFNKFHSDGTNRKLDGSLKATGRRKGSQYLEVAGPLLWMSLVMDHIQEFQSSSGD